MAILSNRHYFKHFSSSTHHSGAAKHVHIVVSLFVQCGGCIVKVTADTATLLPLIGFLDHNRMHCTVNLHSTGPRGLRPDNQNHRIYSMKFRCPASRPLQD